MKTEICEILLCITVLMVFSLNPAVAAPSVPIRAQVAPSPLFKRELALPQASLADLVITNIAVIQDGTGAIVAQLQIKNIGQAPVTIPVGTVIARGDVQGGSVTFPSKTVDYGFALFPGTSFSIGVPSSGWCPGGKPGSVTFRVNPDNALAESDKSNNAFVLPATSLYGDISSAVVWLESQRFPPVGISGLIEPGMRNTLPLGAGADIIVGFTNPGPGFVVVCPGTTLLRDVQSPLSGMYGLKSYKYPFGITVRPGEGTTVKLQGAVGAFMLNTGSYPWQFLLNPEGTIVESSAANNAASVTVRVTPPIP